MTKFVCHICIQRLFSLNILITWYSENLFSVTVPCCTWLYVTWPLPDQCCTYKVWYIFSYNTYRMHLMICMDSVVSLTAYKKTCDFYFWGCCIFSMINTFKSEKMAGTLQTFLNAFSWLKKKKNSSVPKGPFDKKTVLVQVMAWCLTGDKPLHEPMLTQNYNVIWCQ